MFASEQMHRQITLSRGVMIATTIIGVLIGGLVALIAAHVGTCPTQTGHEHALPAQALPMESRIAELEQRLERLERKGDSR